MIPILILLSSFAMSPQSPVSEPIQLSVERLDPARPAARLDFWVSQADGARVWWAGLAESDRVAVVNSGTCPFIVPALEEFSAHARMSFYVRGISAQPDPLPPIPRHESAYRVTGVGVGLMGFVQASAESNTGWLADWAEHTMGVIASCKGAEPG